VGRTVRETVLCIVGGLLVAAIGVVLLARRDAACVMDAMHPAAQADPPYDQEMTLFPLRWTCTWTGVGGSPATTFVDPLASAAFYGGLALAVGATVVLVLHLVIARAAVA
jgi:hypothetical protein